MSTSPSQSRVASGGGSGLPRTVTLDGLRGIAVLAVVIEHAWRGALPGGFAGVDVFFVLSGYLITRIIVAELEGTGQLNLWNFYARRVRRILPASLMTVAGTVLLYLVLLGPATPSSFRDEALATTFSISNFLFANRSVDYFASNPATSPFLHFWSLAVEEQFYLVWPGLLLLITLGVRRFAPSRSWLAPAIVAVIGLASLALAIRWNVVDAFFLLPARAWELAAGGLFAWVQFRGHATLPASLRRFRWVGVLGGYLLLAVTFAAAPSLGRWPGLATILPVVGSALLVAGGDAMPGARILTFRPIQFFGRISYALYLWHWPFLAALALLALPVAATPFWVPLIAVVIAILVATGSTILFEEPIRSSRRPSLVGRRAVWNGLGSMPVVGIAVAILVTGVPQVMARDGFGAALAISRTDRERIIADKCVTSMTSSTVKDCVYGSADKPSGAPVHAVPDGSEVMVLFGDSHAMHWFPAVNAWAKTNGLALVPIMRSACPPIDAPLLASTNALTRSCTTWREHALARIAELHPALTVVSGSLGTGVVLDGFSGAPRNSDMSAWIAPATRMLDEVRTRSTAVVLLGDVPRPSFSVTDCLAAHRWDPISCARPLDAVMPPVARAAEARAAADAGVVFADPVPWLCAPDSCDWMAGEAVGWVDEQHLTSSGALNALQQLGKVLANAMSPTAMRARGT